MSWYLAVLKQYGVFSGRARRREYWMFVLFNFLFALVPALIEVIGNAAGSPVGTFGTVLSVIYSLAFFIPGLAVEVRRLHDTGRSGFWLFLILVPLAGPIILLIFFAEDSKPGENKYGLNPKEAYPVQPAVAA